jgi:uncharacterized protein YdcH (DUF465 family)
MSVKQVIKFKHKELKSKVNEVEELRGVNRSIDSWYDLRELKKLKLKTKDKLNEIKQKLQS